MKNYTKYLIPILIGLTFLGIGFAVGKGCNSPSKTPYYQEPGFKTDTIIAPSSKLEQKVEKENKEWKDKSSVMPPKTVTIYKPEVTFIHDTIYQRIMTDTNSGLAKVLREKYIFINGKFTRQSLRLTLQDIEGITYERDYPVDYSSYEYYHDGKDLKVAKTSNPPSNKLTTSSFAYLGYEPFQKAPTIMVDYSINYKKVGLYVMGMTDYSIPKDEAGLRITGGLRIRIR